MKFILYFFIAILINSQGFAQLFQIKFNINDSAQNRPVSNANISLSDKFFSTSNNSGLSLIKNIPKGIYSLNISHIGYQSFTQNITLISDTTLDIQLIPTSIRLDEVLVISGRYEQNINLLPYSMSVIQSSDIKLNPSQTVSDLLKTEPGISLLRDGVWGTEISIRGLNRSNIITLIDGDRVETSTDISARLSMIDLYDIDRIEVIKGAASSLYGSGATGGIINIISKSGSYSNDFSLKGSYSGGFNSVNNYYSNGISFTASGNEWVTKIGGSYRKAGNTKTPNGELYNSQFEDNSLTALFQLSPFENHEIKFNYQQFKAINVGIPGAAPLFPNNAKVTYPEELRRLMSVEYKINNLSSSFVKLSAKYFHQFISRDVENIPGTTQFIPGANGQPPKRVSVLKISPGADHNVDGFQTQADFNFTRNYLIAGFDFWKRNYSGLRTKDQRIEILNPTDSSTVSTNYKTIFEKPLPDANFYSAGIYAQDEIKLVDNLNLTLGSRYDFIWLNNSETKNPLYEVNNGITNNNPAGQKIIWNSETAKNKSYTFNLGLVYSINDYSNISLNAARSFRSPSLEERYQYIDLGNLIRVGDPNLKPEQGYFFDLGFRFFPDNLKITTSIFLNTLNDLVSEVPGIYDGRNALIKVNIGKALLYGFEYSVNVKLIDRVSIYNTLSYVRGKNQKDNLDLPQIPPLNSLTGVKYFISDWLSADLSATIFDSQKKVAPGELQTPGYTYFNLQIDLTHIQIGKISLGFSAGIENILDKSYRDHLSSNRGLIVSEPGRNFFIKTNIAF